MMPQMTSIQTWRIRALCAIVLVAALGAWLSGRSCSNAEGLRKLPLHAELTKQTTSFQIKNLYAFKLPDDLPATINFRGFVGSLATTTQPNPAMHGAVGSETLFAIGYTKNGTCPVSGQEIGSYAETYARFPAQGLGALILKQARPGAETFPVALLLPERLPIHLKPGGCIYVSFDGTDFAGLPYTIRSDLTLLYDTGPPQWGTLNYTSLDSEFIVSPSTAHGPVLNAYVVLPVSKKGPVYPGRLISLYGDVSATAPPDFARVPSDRARWSIRDIVAIYRNGSCQRAFPNHSPNKFFWNDWTGAGNQPNLTYALKPDAARILDIPLDGNGLDSVMRQANAIEAVPASVKEGDCVVMAILPNSNNAAISGSVNVETQITVVSTP